MSIDKVKAAIMAPERDVPEPRRAKQSSFAAQVMDLEVGQSASRVAAVTMTASLAQLQQDIPAQRDNLRNGCAPAVKRAKERVQGEYTTEVGVMTMPGMTMYVVAVVTRVA